MGNQQSWCKGNKIISQRRRITIMPCRTISSHLLLIPQRPTCRQEPQWLLQDRSPKWRPHNMCRSSKILNSWVWDKKTRSTFKTTKKEPWVKLRLKSNLKVSFRSPTKADPKTILTSFISEEETPARTKDKILSSWETQGKTSLAWICSTNRHLRPGTLERESCQLLLKVTSCLVATASTRCRTSKKTSNLTQESTNDDLKYLIYLT